MKIADFFVALGISIDKKSANETGKLLKSIRRGLIEIKIATAVAGYGLEKFVEGTMNSTVALQNLSNQTDLSIEKLQKWQQAGQLVDITLTPEKVASSISALENSIAKIRRGAGNIAPFQLLGIDIQGKDAFEVLEQLRENIKGLDSATATGIIQELGLGKEFINALRVSREEFELLGKNVFLNKNQRQAILEYGTELTRLKLRFKALKDQAVAKIAPDLTKLIEDFFGWLVKNGDKVTSVMSSTVRVFSDFVKAVANAVVFMKEFVETSFGMENGLKALAVGFGLITLSLSPVIASFVALLLLLDDIRVFQKGGKSVIGEIFDFFGTLKGVPSLKDLLGGDGLIDFLTSLSIQLGSITNFLTKIGEKSTSVLKAIGVGAGVGSLIPGVGTITGGAVGGFIGAGSRIGQVVADKINEVLDRRAGITNNVTQNIYGTGDPVVTGNTATRELINAQSQLE